MCITSLRFDAWYVAMRVVVVMLERLQNHSYEEARGAQEAA